MSERGPKRRRRLFQAGRGNAYHHGVCYAGRDGEGECERENGRGEVEVEVRIRLLLMPQAERHDSGRTFDIRIKRYQRVVRSIYTPENVRTSLKYKLE